MARQKRKSAGKAEGIKKNWLEWLVFGIGSLLICLVLANLLFQMVRKTDPEPHLSLKAWPDSRHHEPFRYKVLVTNNGDVTAEGIVITGAAFKNGFAVEQASIRLDFCARHSEEEGWLNFNAGVGQSDSTRFWIESYRIAK